jgi:signal transduction histidine kinase
MAARLARAERDARDSVDGAVGVARRRLRAGVEARTRDEVETLRRLVPEIERALAGRDAAAAGARLADAGAAVQRALATLREVLDALGGPAAGGAEDPREALADALAALRDAGAVTRVRERGDAALSSAGQTVVAARVLEEALGRDGAGAHARVTLLHGPRELRVAVTGRGAGPPALADPARLAGLRERVRLHGGLVEVGGGWGWRLRLVLPLTLREPVLPQRWDERAVDAALAVGSAAIVLFDVAVLPVARPVLSGVLGIGTAALPLAVRRRRPLATCAVSAGGLVAGARLGALPAGPVPGYLIMAVVPFAAAAHAPTGRRAVAGVAVTTGGALAATAIAPGPSGTSRGELTRMAAFGALCGGVAWLSRRRHGRALALAVGEEDLRARHPLLLDRALERERASVARDLHDLVAHGMTLAAVTAGAAAARVRAGAWDAARGDVRALAEAVDGTERELARMLAVLAGDPTAGDDRRGLDGIAALVRQARRAGQDVTLAPPPGEVPSPDIEVADCAYRVVQEGLANARRHAAGAPVTVALRAQDGTLLVAVHSGSGRRAPAGTHGAGRGLAGLRERTRAVGGTLAAGLTADGGFAVQAALPLFRPA